MTKKNTTGKVPATKVEKPTIINFTKSQKALYREVVADIQEKTQTAAQQVILIGNKNLSRHIDDFAEELGIMNDGFDYDVDVQKFQFKRRPKKEKEDEGK